MANSERDTLTILVEEAARLLMTLREAVSSPERFTTFMARMGWTIENIPQPIMDLSSGLDLVFDGLENVVDGDLSSATIEDLRSGVTDVFTGIRELVNAPDVSFPTHLITDNFKSEFPAQLVEHLLADYLTRHYPRAAFALRALGVMRIEYKAEIGNRPAFMRYALQFSDFLDVIDEPKSIFRNAFGWGTDEFRVDFLFDQIENLLISLGVAVTRDLMDEDIAAQLEGGIEFPGDPEREAVNAVFLERHRPSGRLAAEVKFIELPGDATIKPGFAILPSFNGVLGFRMQVADDVAVTVDGGFDLQGGVGLIFRPEQEIEVLIGFADGDAPTAAVGEISFKVELEDEDSEPIVVLGEPSASRLEFKNASGKGGLLIDLANNRKEIFIEADLQGGKLVIAPGQGDGFLQNILPQDGIEASFELAAGFSNLRGFYFRGSGGIEIELPIHLDLGVVEIPALTIGVQPIDGKIPVNLGVNIKAELGPLKAVVENMGLAFNFSFPDNGGNLGPLDLDLCFKPPTGIGLAIEGGGFKGGGTLGFDPVNERYYGNLELEYQDKIELKAIGLLTTKLPGGKEGFSLLIIITAEFTPIQLGFGFTLNGVGGLLGLNRTAKIERLRTGVKDNTLSSVLFPTDIVVNANRIISDLRQVFPAQENRFIFGPMAKIGWGSPTLITIDLGLFIEVPDPVRLAILGVVRATLPDEKAALLKLQVNFLGVIDFEKKQLSFDASLYNSKLLAFTLSGDMAIRLNWGNDPNFLLTVGGFHPAYEPPPMNLPAIRRLTLQLLEGNNPRLTLETYFAVTSNTVQFGAKLELYAGAGSFNVYGFLSFDALFQFNPFYFIAVVNAMLALRRGSSSIASIKLDLTLEGTTPWKAYGTARLKLFWFLTVKVSFSKTFGEERNITFPDIEVIPLLEAALSNTGNWQSQIPTRSHLLVSLKQIEAIGDKIITHPFGILEISQKVVPLNLRIDKFGNQKPSDGNELHIQNVKIGTEAQNTAETEEFFAPAQFFEKTDSEKISSKSFEKYDSGIRIVDSEKLDSDYYAKRDVGYELFYIDSQRDQLLALWPDFLAPDAVAFNSWAVKGAISNSDLSFSKNRKSALAPDEVSVGQERFAVVNTSDLTVFDNDSLVKSEVGALSKMQDLIQENPALEGNIQVVPQFEVNEL